MITLYRHSNCTECDSLQDTLENLVLAHRIAYIAEEGAGNPAVLDDEGNTVEGEGPIETHLEKLSAFREEWQKFQTDACYCDDEGNVE